MILRYIKNNDLVESRLDSQTLSGHALQDYTFDGNGPVRIVIENINGIDTGVEFDFLIGEDSEEVAIPEWVRNNAKWWSEKQN